MCLSSSWQIENPTWRLGNNFPTVRYDWNFSHAMQPFVKKLPSLFARSGGTPYVSISSGLFLYMWISMKFFLRCSLPVFLPLNRPITDQPTLAAPCCLWSRLLKRATKRKLMSLGDLSYSLPPKFITSLGHSFLLLLSLCVYFSLTFYSSEHGFFLTLVGWGQSTARMASSNTVFRPRWVKAEHSRYFTASASEETQNNTSKKTTYRNEQEVNKLKLHVWALTPLGDDSILIGWSTSVN